MNPEFAAFATLALLAPVLLAGAIGGPSPPWAIGPLPAGIREFALVMQGTSFDGASWPNAPVLEAYVGDTVTFTVAVPPALAEPHTFHVHGHTWEAEDGTVIDTRLLFPGNVTRFTLVAGGFDLQAGDWLYHCHVDAHLAGGMSGLFRVYPFTLALDRAPSSGPDALTLRVRAERLGEPVPVDAIAVDTAEGVPLAATWREVAPGAFEARVPLTLATSSARGLVVTASGPLGSSVARFSLPGAELPTAPAAGRAETARHAHGA